MEIKIKNIEQKMLNDQFDSYRFTYDVVHNGRIRTVKRYIPPADLGEGVEANYENILAFIRSKEEAHPIETFEYAMAQENEIESETEINHEQEEF